MTDENKKDKYKPVPFQVKEKCKKLVIAGKKTYAEIEQVTGVPETQIAKWVKDGGWRQTKMKLHRERWEDAEISYRDFQAEEKERTARRQLDAASLIENKVKENVEGINPDDKGADVRLARAARTLNDVSSVSARAVGMAERKEESAAIDGSGAKKQGKIPVIVVGVHARKPDETPAIDVEFSEADDDEED